MQQEKKSLSKIISNFIRMFVLVFIVLSFMGYTAVKLMQVQVVDGGKYLLKEDTVYQTTRTTPATRGQIVDAKGNPVVRNKVGFSVIIQNAFFPKDNEAANEVIRGILKILEDNNVEYNDILPITKSENYEFDGSDNAIASLTSKININSYSTAENCIDKLIDMYKITGTQQDIRAIAGIRYSMLATDFSLKTDFVLCDNLPEELILTVKEYSMILLGVNVAENSTREYVQPTFLPQKIGVVTKIYAEDYPLAKEEGYALNDVRGKGGLEENLENYLKGTKGEERITVVNGEVTQTETIIPAVAGNTIKLTIDPDFQNDIQQIMENHITYLRKKASMYNTVQSAATVVIDLKTGAVLALGSLPTYNLLDYTEDYDAFMESIEHYGRQDTPLINRSTDGLYRPGSTFKTVTATAGLNEGIIKRNSTFFCGRYFNYLGSVMHCTGYHANISVELAITKSCNIFFYELGKRLGVDKLCEYERMYGLGSSLGLECGDKAGWLANPETFEENGWEWNSGLLCQAAIGQSEIAVTPLQMAVIAATIANRGERVQPHIVDAIYDYNMDNIIEQKGREVVYTIPLAYPEIYDYIIKGMIGAAKNTPSGEYSLNGLGYTVAIKTGTPQSPHVNKTSSAFIGFAPVENPQIAFAGIYEGGEYSKYTIRKILDAYQERYGKFELNK